MKHLIKVSFSRRLFLSIVLVFVAFAGFFMAYQYHREKEYRIELLNTRLQGYNHQLGEELEDLSQMDDSIVSAFVSRHFIEDLRVTIILKNGKVVYDNQDAHVEQMSNHADRVEVKTALEFGEGYDINRASASLNGKSFFYSATYFKNLGLVIRSSLPYTVSLIHNLDADLNYLWFTLLVGFIVLFFFYRYSSRLGKNITQLREFSRRMEHSEPLNELRARFADDELGEILKHIVGLYEQLHSSELDKIRLKKQLTQNIAHELKTPVSSIQGYLETIVSNPDMSESTRKDFLERCYGQSQRLSNLLRDISVLTRMEEAPNLIEKDDVNINQLIANVQKDVEPQMKDKKMEFLNMMIGDIRMKGNPSLLYSIFRNLTDNAIAYAGEGACITVKCMHEDKDFYYFSFADNGVGVAKEHLPFLFERFYRIDKGRSRKLGGTGLGLAVVKNAVLIHGGTISAKIAQTGGLEFDFTLAKEA